MELDKMIMRRRALLGSIAGGGLGMAFGLAPARAAPHYPQLENAAIPVRNLTGNYLVAGAMAGPRLVAGGEEGLIIYSDDAGATWHQARVPVSVTITCLAFATPRVGWATGGFGVILGTTDGGATWTKQLDGNAEITLMNTVTQAYVASQPAGSDDADRATRRADILTQQGADKPFLSLLPVSATEIFAFGTYRSAEYSSDGGKSWADINMRIGDTHSQNIYGAAAIGGAYYLVSEAGLIFRSTDGGQSFPQLAQPGSATLFGICDAGGGNLLAYGVAGEMFLSTDGGKTWNAPNFTGTANVNCAATLASGELVVGDSGGALWLSKDRGQTFKLVLRNPLVLINALLPLAGTRLLILSEVGIVPADISTMQG